MRSLLLLSSLFFIVNSDKIAVFLNAMSNSHVIFTIRVAEELAADHDVVIVRPTVNPKATTIVSNHPRVLEIRTNGASAETFASHKEIERNMVWTDASYKDIAAMSASYTKIFSEYCTSLINDEESMAKLRAEKFDFALAHHIDLCPVSVINALEIPHFGFIMSIPLNRMWVNIAGVPMLSSIYPMIMMDATNEMNFLQRFKNFVLDVMMGTIGGPMQAKPINGVMRKKYGEAFPDAMELAAKAKFVLVNAHPDIEFPLPLTSKIGYFGGLGMSNESKPLIEPYSSFIGSAKSIVFVSFGTVADPAMMPISWKNAFLELFEKNPDVHFIWRMVDGVTVPKNVLINSWHPQNDILAHPKTVAFITHAGYNSIGESIASGTPLITIPLAADQFRNSRLVEYRGFGVRVDKTSINFDSLNSALHTILNNPSYAKSAESLRKIVFSSPIKAGDALRHAVNFALYHPDHNRDLPSLNFIQLYSLDMISIIISITIIILLVILFILKLLWRCICGARDVKYKKD